jgi:hypothetical protein
VIKKHWYQDSLLYVAETESEELEKMVLSYCELVYTVNLKRVINHVNRALLEVLAAALE